MMIRERTQLMVAGVALCALAACKSSSETHAGWSYQGDTGPTHWSELSPAYELAATGKQQSPIDISRAQLESGGGTVSVQCSTKLSELVNNGHSIQANVVPGGTLTTPTGTYELKQFHFHSPSEHTVDGEHFAMELHLVHLDAKSNIAVVGVMIKEGPENAFLAKLWPHLPAEKGNSADLTGLEVGPKDLLPTSRETWRYTGSLTTPPCTENVDWTMMQTPITASAAQIAAFRNVMYHNNRPTQPLNGRAIKAGN